MNKIREDLLKILLAHTKPLQVRQVLETLQHPQEDIESTLSMGIPSDENSIELRMWRTIFSNWDNAEGNWTQGTPQRSKERRALTITCLSIEGTILHNLLSDRKIIPLNEPKIEIAVLSSHQKQEDWYTPTENGYWENYKKYLYECKKWSPSAISVLDITTTRIINNLKNPLSCNLNKVKGLVVGHVQSGKTSNYSALIAKAVDAGYRLIIILSGRTDILRNQTQARLDMELMGWDSLDASEKQEYIEKGKNQRQDYVGKFVKYEYIPPSNSFLRLTKTDKDFNQGSIALRYTGHPQIAVLKKIPKRLKDFAEVLGESEWRNKPVLLIDDESDDGSINTSKTDITRTAGLINNILEASDASQYVGYTATPYANVFIRPERVIELFPSDFVICLDRPEHYMGALEMFDIGDCDLNSDESNEKAYIRAVKEAPACSGNLLAAPPMLSEAIDSFILSGAIKKWRESKHGIVFKHHTMLINTDHLTSGHQQMAEIVEKLIEKNYPLKELDSESDKRLEHLWMNDFIKISNIRNSSVPKSWNELKPFASDSIKRILNEKVLIVNCEKHNDTPSFEDAIGTWAILIGGSKLSRGYTIEGLTTSYFSRKPGQLDTLVQMARWYGFRKGYSDIVRLYMPETLPRGKKRKSVSSKSKTPDKKYHLLNAFRFGARVEESFRKNLIQYSNDLKPKDIPPLVQYEFKDFPHDFKYLDPTAKNKMRHAQLEISHLGGVVKTITRIGGSKVRASNQLHLERLLDSCINPISEKDLIFNNGKYKAITGVTDSTNHLAFLKNINFYDKNIDEKPNIINEQIEALSKMEHFSWRVLIFMQTENKNRLLLSKYSLPHWIRNYEFSSDGVLIYDKPLNPPHRKVAAWLAKLPEGNDLLTDDAETLKLQDEKCGVIYIVPFTSAATEHINNEFYYLWCAVFPGKGRAAAYRVVSN